MGTRGLPAGLIPFILFLAAGCSPKQKPLPATVADTALQYAFLRIGDSYILSGQSPGGFDCSGLVLWAYGRAYPNLKLRFGRQVVPDASIDVLWNDDVVQIASDSMKPGDIVFITNTADSVAHGGLFIRWLNPSHRKFLFVDASSWYGKVVVDTWPLKGKKRGQWFVGAGRLETVY